MENGHSSPKKQEPFEVLILGGSYGGLSTALNLLDLCNGKPTRAGFENPIPDRKVPVNVTVLDERDGFFHLIGTPLALIDEKYARKAWKKYDQISELRHPQMQLKQGSVTSIDCEKLEASIRFPGADESFRQQYDYLVTATGLRRAWPSVPQSLSKKLYLEEVGSNIHATKAAEGGVVIVGGGAVGVEMAAETKHVYPHLNVKLIHSRERLLNAEPLPDEFKDTTLELLRKNGVEVITGKRVVETFPCEKPSSTKTTLRLSDRTKICASLVLTAVSRPEPTATSYLPKELLESDGCVKVSASLHFGSSNSSPFSRIISSRHFAVGDLAAWPVSHPVIKRCGNAFHMGHFAAFNIHQHMLYSHGLVEEPEYKKFPEFGPAMALALGDTAVGFSDELGLTQGSELRERMFGDDLGLGICRQYLGWDREEADDVA